MDIVPPVPGALLVRELVTLVDDGEVIDSSAFGALTIEEETRAARPYRHLHEDAVYQEQTWTIVHEDGASEHGMRVWRLANEDPALHPSALPEAQPAPPLVDHQVDQLLELDWAPDEAHYVTVVLRGFPPWDVPLRPQPGIQSAERMEAQAVAREARLVERRALYDSMSKELIASVIDEGGEVALQGRASGWVNFRVTKPALLALTSREDLRTVFLDEGDLTPGWHLGDGRSDSRTDAGDYFDNSYDGGAPPGGGERIRIAFIENGAIHHNARAFMNASGTSFSRIYKKYDCNYDGGSEQNGWCELVPSSQDMDPDYGSVANNHGMMVVSVAIGDYMDDQCHGMLCGDTTTTHSSQWKSRATGYAPEAQGIFFGNIGQSASQRVPRHAEAFERAVSDGADIVSFSQGLVSGSERCHPPANLASEREAEDAFDDGVLVVACAGNYAYDPDDPPDPPTTVCDTTCGTFSVGSLAKTLAVAGYDSSASPCNGGTHSACRLDRCGERDDVTGFCVDAFSSCRGGANASINGTSWAGVLSLTDLLMATHVQSVTWYENRSTGIEEPQGWVGQSHTGGGCSTATPQVAGVAAAIKDYHIQIGHSWIHNPGRLHTLLLLMGDRATVSDSNPDTGTISLKSSGTSPYWGLGRLRVRYWPDATLAPAVRTSFTVSLTPSSGTWTTRPFLTSLPLPTGVDLVKCVAFQMEDLTGESVPVTISDVDLSIRVRWPVSGSCPATEPGGSPTFTRTDSSPDWKKMGAITSAQAALAGRCVYASLTPAHVESAGISVQLACYYSGALESEG